VKHRGKNTRHTSTAPVQVPLRDLTDSELSEAIDSDRERAEQLLHADTRWCPECEQPTLASRSHTCLFCDAPTLPIDVRDARVSTSSQRRGRFSTAHGSVAAGESNDERDAA
jgi:hypothetical protein